MRRAVVCLLPLFVAVWLVACTPTPPPPSAAPQPSKLPATPIATESTKAATTVAAQAVAGGKTNGYPQDGKTVTLIVPWSPGGPSDISARVLASEMEKDLGVPVAVINKPGAGGQIGFTDMAKARPDGYTFGYTSLWGPVLNYLDPDRKAAFAPQDVRPIAMAMRTPGTLSVNGQATYRSLADLIATGKSSPGKVRMADTGLMSIAHLVSLQLQALSGAKFSAVHFDGVAPGIAAVLGGHVDAAIGDTSPAVMEPARAGQSRVLAYTGTGGVAPLPGTRTFSEQGYDMQVESNLCIWGPAGIPEAITSRISGIVKRTVGLPEQRKRFLDLGLDPRFMEGAELLDYWKATEKTAASLMELARREGS